MHVSAYFMYGTYFRACLKHGSYFHSFMHESIVTPLGISSHTTCNTGEYQMCVEGQPGVAKCSIASRPSRVWALGCLQVIIIKFVNNIYYYYAWT